MRYAGQRPVKANATIRFQDHRTAASEQAQQSWPYTDPHSLEGHSPTEHEGIANDVQAEWDNYRVGLSF